MGNHIYFADAILKNENKIKGKTKVHSSLRKYKNKGSYDNLTDIIEDVALVQLMDSLGNFNRAIRYVG